MANEGIGIITYVTSVDGGTSFGSSFNFNTHYRKSNEQVEIWNRLTLDKTIDAFEYQRRNAVLTIPAIDVQGNATNAETLQKATFIKMTLSGDTDFDGSFIWKSKAKYEYEGGYDIGKYLEIEVSRQTVS